MTRTPKNLSQKTESAGALLRHQTHSRAQTRGFSRWLPNPHPRSSSSASPTAPRPPCCPRSCTAPAGDQKGRTKRRRTTSRAPVLTRCVWTPSTTPWTSPPPCTRYPTTMVPEMGTPTGSARRLSSRCSIPPRMDRSRRSPSGAKRGTRPGLRRLGCWCAGTRPRTRWTRRLRPVRIKRTTGRWRTGTKPWL